MQVICASNIRGIGQALVIYAKENAGALPSHYFAADEASKTNPGRHGVSWIGAMGSHPDLRVTQETRPGSSAKRGHPSRSLFLLISGGQSSPGQFICPASGDQEDDLLNTGSDATGVEGRAVAGKTRFDFRGYDSLSYAFSLPFASSARLDSRPTRPNAVDPMLPLMADKGPYFEAGNDTIPDTKTTSDRATNVKFPSAWSTLSAAQLKELSNDDWSPFNSRNHGGAGQQVLYADSHVDFQKRPTVGLNNDNIYTINLRPGDAAAGMLGLRPIDAPLDGPIANTDSYIVP